MVSRSSQYQCLLWAPNVHCFEWCSQNQNYISIQFSIQFSLKKISSELVSRPSKMGFLRFRLQNTIPLPRFTSAHGWRASTWSRACSASTAWPACPASSAVPPSTTRAASRPSEGISPKTTSLQSKCKKWWGAKMDCRQIRLVCTARKLKHWALFWFGAANIIE